MRKLINRIKNFSLLVGLSILASCSTSKPVVQTLKSAAYESLIPVSEQSVVIAANVAQIKSKISSDAQSTLNLFLNLGLAGNEDLRWVSTLANNPENIGVNTTKNVYYVAYPSVNNNVNHAIYFSLNNISKFEKFLFSDAHLDKARISEVAGFKYCQIDTDLHLFYNNVIATLASSKEFVESMVGTKQTLINYSSFNSVKGANDLAITYTSEGLAALVKMFGKSSFNDLFLSNTLATNSSCTLNFESGEIVFDQNNYASAGKSKENFDKALGLLKPVSGKYSKMIAKDPYFYGLMGLKGEGFMDLVELLLKSQGTNVERQSTREMLDLAKSFLDNVNGDVLFAVSDFSVGFSSVSIDASLFVEGNAAKMYDIVLENLPKKLITSLTKTQMELVVDKVKLFIGIHDDFFYVTTNGEIAANPGAGKKENLTNSRYYKKDAVVAQGAFDMKSIMNNPLVKLSLAQQKSSEDVTTKEMIEFANGMDYISSESVIRTGVLNTNSKLVIDTKSPNTLTILIDMILRIALASK